MLSDHPDDGTSSGFGRDSDAVLPVVGGGRCRDVLYRGGNIGIARADGTLAGRRIKSLVVDGMELGVHNGKGYGVSCVNVEISRCDPSGSVQRRY